MTLICPDRIVLHPRSHCLVLTCMSRPLETKFGIQDLLDVHAPNNMVNMVATSWTEHISRAMSVQYPSWMYALLRAEDGYWRPWPLKWTTARLRHPYPSSSTSMFPRGASYFRRSAGESSLRLRGVGGRNPEQRGSSKRHGSICSGRQLVGQRSSGCCFFVVYNGKGKTGERFGE